MTNPFQSDSLNSIAPLLSDVIVVDEGWRSAFYEAQIDPDATTTGRIVRELLDRKLVDEIRLTPQLLGPEAGVIVRATFEGVAQFGRSRGLSVSELERGLCGDFGLALRNGLGRH